MSEEPEDPEDKPPDPNTKALAEAIASIGDSLGWLAAAMFIGLLAIAAAIHH